jgi:hypothetical protein
MNTRTRAAQQEDDLSRGQRLSKVPLVEKGTLAGNPYPAQSYFGM